MTAKKKILRIILILFILNLIISLFVFLSQSVFKNRTFEIQNLSTFQQWAIIIITLISLVVIGNFLIHRYYQKKHTEILYRIKNEKYEIFKNLKLTQTWNFGFRINRADVILIKDQIIVLIYNSNFNGLIKQAQPAILFYKEKYLERINEKISSKSKIEGIFSTTNGFKITTKVDSLFNKTNLSFSFETDANQKNQIIKILNENSLM